MLKLLADIAPILLKSAPTIATALGSPLAGIAMTLVSTMFGTDEKDPNSLIKKVMDDVPTANSIFQELECKHGGVFQKLLNSTDTLSSAEINIKLTWCQYPTENV